MERMIELPLRGENEIFVFGSNLAGIHGAGAALAARKHCGAILYKGVGRQGKSYAIPTKDEYIETMELKDIRPYVRQFIRYAREHSELTFLVTRIGCGLAGLKDSEVAPMFHGAPDNCVLPDGWKELANGRE